MSSRNIGFIGQILGFICIVAFAIVAIYGGYKLKVYIYNSWYGLSTQDETNELKIKIDSLTKRVEALELKDK